MTKINSINNNKRNNTENKRKNISETPSHKIKELEQERIISQALDDHSNKKSHK